MSHISWVCVTSVYFCDNFVLILVILVEICAILEATFAEHQDGAKNVHRFSTKPVSFACGRPKKTKTMGHAFFKKKAPLKTVIINLVDIEFPFLRREPYRCNTSRPKPEESIGNMHIAFVTKSPGRRRKWSLDVFHSVECR